MLHNGIRTGSYTDPPTDDNSLSAHAAYITQGLNSVHAGMNSLRANVTLSAAVMNNLIIG